jgi:hypothetical protein
MATQYGVQFEALMSEVCRDFGAKLLKSWDPKATKSEVKEFVDEAVANFFKTHVSSPEPAKAAKKPKKAKAVDVTVEVTEPEPAKAAKKPKKAKAVDVTVEVTEPEPAKAKGKAKKPKCQAVTAKGTPCSKCAAEGEPFCAVHLKKAPAAEKSEKAPAKKGGKGGKASPPKHTHSLTSPPLKENPCELCETHGMPFEVPEYEEDMEYAYDPTDPEFVLNEEDFEESDDDDADFDEID